MRRKIWAYLIPMAVGASLVAIGCLSTPDGDGGDASEKIEAAGRDVDHDARTIRFDNIVVHGGASSPSAVRVEIFDQQGTKLFGVDFGSGGGAPRSVEWRLFGFSSAESATDIRSGSIDVEIESIPRIEDAMNAAFFIYRKVLRGLDDVEYDRWGCDLLPGRFNSVVSCGNKGACCDTHDACYARNGCTARSWTQPWREPAECLGCNANAVGCFLSDSPGPSECCALGNCGEER